VANDISADLLVAVRDAEIIGFDILEFSLIVAGITFCLCLICCGACCCARIKSKKKRTVNQENRD
jgi:hypothetical protein